MGVINRYAFTGGWQPSADDVNASPDSLLRMDNLVHDEEGALSLRQGSSKENSTALATIDVRSIYSVVMNSIRQRIAQGSGSIYAAAGSGAYSSIASGFDSTLDVAFSSYLGFAFMASGSIKKKFDGSTVTNWGIDAPASAPTVSQTNPKNAVLASCDSGETTWTDEEISGSASYVTGFDGTANGARQITSSASTFRGVMSRDLGVSTDFTVLDGVPESPDDVIEFWAKIDDPSKVSSITIIVDLSGITTPSYDQNFMTYTWPTAIESNIPSNAHQIVINDAISGGYYDHNYIQQAINQVDQAISDETIVTSPSPNTWHYYSAKRSAFTHIGSGIGHTWGTVRGVRVSFQGNGQGTVAIDRIRVVGGSGTQLTGTYVYRAIYVREGTAYNALGVASEASGQIILKNQSSTLAVVNPTDTQVTHVWLYRMGEFLPTFYRVGRIAVTTYTTADYTASWETSYFTSTAGRQFDYTADFEVDFVDSTLTANGPSNRTASWETAYLPNYAGYTNVPDGLSDASALIVNIKLDPDNALPPDNIISVSEDYYTRLYALASDGKVYPSRRLNPESFSIGQQFRIGGPSETPYWIKKSIGGLYVGTSKDIYRVSGTGAELPDGTMDVVVQPLNINSPPVDSSVAADGNILIYRASDGPRLFTGETSTPLKGATDLLWRGYARHGVSAINTTGGRFRMAIAKGCLNILVPEGTDTTSTTVIYRYNMARQQWYRLVYPASFRSIFREPDGTLAAGDNAGFVWILDDSTATGDGGTGIAVNIRTKVDDFGMEFNPKRTASMLLRLDTGGATSALDFHFDGSSAASFSAAPSSSGMGLASKDLLQKKFRQIQWRLSGNFTTFRFYGYAINFVEAPESVEVFDSGPINFDTRNVAFVRTIRLKAQTEHNLTVTPYLNGTAQATKTITTICNEATVYEVQLGREIKAEQPRFVIQAPAGQTFEPYWLECTYRESGNMTEKKTIRITP